MWTDIEDSDEFFDWFLGEIEAHSPDYKNHVMSHSQQKISNSLPNLSKEQMDYTFKKIREIITIPSNVYLVYDSKIQTYASRYNAQKKRLEIIIPTYGYYHTRFAPVIKAAIQHEMGHILNRDYKVQVKGHSSCLNQCMDIRINQNIDREWLRDLFDAVYYFRVKKFTMLVPEETLPNWGLRLKKHGTYSYSVIHKYFHLNDKKKKEKPPKEYKTPSVGDIVMVNKSKKYGKVVEIKDGKAVVEEMTADEVKETFKG